MDDIHDSTIFKVAAKTPMPENRVAIDVGYYWYAEQDTKKIIYVFGEKKFTDVMRYYYYDFSEKGIRSFRVDNASFVSRTERVIDMDTIKVYDLQIANEMKSIAHRYSELIRILRSTVVVRD